MAATITIQAQCDMCGKIHSVEADLNGYREWRSGKCIQLALPNISADDRELLISGTCGKCFDSIFNGE